MSFKIEYAKLERDMEAFYISLGNEENNSIVDYTFLYKNITHDNSFEVFEELNEIVNSCIGTEYKENMFSKLDELKNK